MGPYGKMRELEIAIKADSQYLANAPLGPIQKKKLEERIGDMRIELKELRKRIRDSKRLKETPR